jgi:cysteine-rich repeat protein
MEQCDLGGDNSNTGACLVTCKDATCGDGQVHEGAEECDDGNNNGDTKACKADCSKNVCGDMKVGPGEECDDGNDNDADACKNDCKLTTQVSCKAIKTGNPAAKDGVYTLDVDGPGPKASFKVYCDMTTDGGGWQIMNYLRKPAALGHPDLPGQRRRRRHARRLLLGPDPPDRQRQLQGAHHHLSEADRERQSRSASSGWSPTAPTRSRSRRSTAPRTAGAIATAPLRRPHRHRRVHPRLHHLPRLRHVPRL